MAAHLLAGKVGADILQDLEFLCIHRNTDLRHTQPNLNDTQHPTHLQRCTLFILCVTVRTAQDSAKAT